MHFNLIDYSPTINVCLLSEFQVNKKLIYAIWSGNTPVTNQHGVQVIFHVMCYNVM